MYRLRGKALTSNNNISDANLKSVVNPVAQITSAYQLNYLGLRERSVRLHPKTTIGVYKYLRCTLKVQKEQASERKMKKRVVNPSEMYTNTRMRCELRLCWFH